MSAEVDYRQLRAEFDGYEDAVLQSLILRPNLFPALELDPDAFWSDSARRLYLAMVESWEDGDREFPIGGVMGRIRAQGLGKNDIRRIETRAAQMLDAAIPRASADMLRWYAKRLMRRGQRLGLAKLKHAYSLEFGRPGTDDERELLQQEAAEVEAIHERFETSDISLNAMRQLEEADKAVMRFGGKVSLGMPQIDELCGDVYPGSVVTILGRAGSGKTLLLCNMITNITKQNQGLGHTCFFASLEMGASAMFARMARVWSMSPHWKQGGHDVRKLLIQETQESIGWSFKAGVTWVQISAALRRWESRWAKSPVGVVFLDYLQLVRAGNPGSNYERMSEVAREAKEFAKRHGVVVVMLSQIKRGESGKKQATVEPSLTDARDSGAIEEAADVVLGLWQAENSVELFAKSLKVRDGAPAGRETQFGVNWSSGVIERAKIQW